MKTELKVTTTKEQAEEFFFNAMCNGLGYVTSGYGLQLDYDNDEYKKSKEKLKSPCLEDVFMQMLRDGYKLTLVDIECDGDNTKSITLKDVHERMDKVPADSLLEMANEQDDATTADVILQTIFFEEIIFG